MIIAEKTCKIEGCKNKYRSSGLCKKHYNREYYREYNKTRLTNRSERLAHAALKQRCTNPNDRSYSHYGGRGIKVCGRWLNGENGLSGFACFLNDMGERPSSKHSIDRINNDGNYEPSNCRWADSTTQAINRRIPKNNKSGFRGVSFSSSNSKWWATIKHNKRNISLGFYDTAEQAAKAYEEGAIKIRGYVVKY